MTGKGFSSVLPHPEWRIIVDLLRGLGYGQFMPHMQIAEATGLQMGTPRYYQHMQQAIKVLLREHNVVIVNVARDGYKRLEPQNHGQETRRYVRLGTRRIKRGGKVAQSTPFELLTPEQQKELEHSMVLMRALHTQMNQLYRSMRNVLPPVGSARSLPAGDGEDTRAVN